MDDKPVHPPIPFGLGSYVTLTGASGAIATFLIAWGENNWRMTGPIAALAVGAIAGIAAWFHGRSTQAAALIDKAEAALKEVGIDISATPDGLADADDTAPKETA